MDTDALLNNLCEQLKICSKVVFITGAGASAESGIPTFRGSSASWWSGVLGVPVLGWFGTPYGWRKAPWLTWPIYDRYMRKPVLSAQPNEFHTLAPWLEARGKDVFVITENVDGLHQKAGTPNHKIQEMHGTLWKNVCIQCQTVLTDQQPNMSHHNTSVPYCASCGGWPRPAALLFSTPFAFEDLVISDITRFDFTNYIQDTVVIIAGLSGKVHSATGLIHQLSFYNGRMRTFHINPGDTEYDKISSVTPIKEKCGVCATKIKRILSDQQ